MNYSASDAHRSASESGRAMRSALESQLGDAPQSNCGPPSIPDHVLLAQIGSGAYGEVWLARSALDTLRAVKIVYRDRFEDDRPFQREFHGILKYEPISRTHEGLIAILHVGRNDAAGCFYYVMELADHFQPPPIDSAAGGLPAASQPFPEYPGHYRPRTLHSELACWRHLPPVQAAQLALAVTQALAHLHKHGLVHRDVKPSNVIFVQGRPKLADIGLITGAGDSRSFVGTEGFIPPEGPGSPQADTYALGKLLYEMATGSDRLEFPQLPADLARSSEGGSVLELNEIITRTCAPDPRQRYATATELVADLNLFLSGRSLREARRLETHVVWLKRFAVAACMVLLLAGLVVGLAKAQERKARQREQSSQQQARLESSLRRRAEAAEQESHQQLFTALLEQARATVRSGEMGQRVRALDAVRRAAAISNNFELRSVALRALALPDLRFERELLTSADHTSFQFDPNFERIATCRGSADVEIISSSDQRLMATLPAATNAPSFYVVWSPDGRFLAVKRDIESFGALASVEVWEVAKTNRVLLVPEVAYGAFSFDGHRPRILTGLRDGEVALWDLSNGKALKRFKLPDAPVFLKLSPTADRFAAAWQENESWTVSIHNAEDGARLASHTGSDRFTCLDWHPQRDLVLTTDHGGWAGLLDPQTGSMRVLGRHKAQAVSALFTPDGGYAITGGWERQLICWDLRTFEPSFTIDLNSFSAQFSADGKKCAIATDPAMDIFSFETPTCHRELGEGLGGRVRHAVFSPDGRWLAVPGQDKLGIWDLVAGGAPALVAPGGGSRLFFSADGQELFASLDDDCFRYKLLPARDPAAPPQVRRLELNLPAGFTSLCLVSNSVIFTTKTGSRIGEIDKGDIVQKHASPTSDGVSGASPDGRWFAVFRPYSLLLNVYRLPGLEPAAVLTNGASISEFAFSADGKELVVAARTRLDFWQTSNWQHVRTLPHFMGILYATRDGPWWLARDFQHAGLYNGRTLDPLLPLPAGVLPLALGPKRDLLAVSVDLGRVQVWHLPEIRAQFQKLGIDWN